MGRECIDTRRSASDGEMAAVYGVGVQPRAPTDISTGLVQQSLHQRTLT